MIQREGRVEVIIILHIFNVEICIHVCMYIHGWHEIISHISVDKNKLSIIIILNQFLHLLI